MKVVWIVAFSGNEEYNVQGVYDEESLALAHRDLLQSMYEATMERRGGDVDSMGSYTVCKEVLNPITVPWGTFLYEVELTRDGEVRRVEWEKYPWSPTPHQVWFYNRYEDETETTLSKCFHVMILANDEDQAVERAQLLRETVLAAGLWDFEEEVGGSVCHLNQLVDHLPEKFTIALTNSVRLYHDAAAKRKQQEQADESAD